MKEGDNILLPILRWKLLGVTLYTCALCIPLILFSLGISDPYPLIFVLLLLGLRSTLINYVLITRMYSNLKDKLLIALFDSLTVLQIFLAIKDMDSYEAYQRIQSRYIIGSAFWSIVVVFIYNLFCKAIYYTSFESILQKRISRIRQKLAFSMKTSLSLSLLVFAAMLFQSYILHNLSNYVVYIFSRYPKSSLLGSLLRIVEALYLYFSYPNLTLSETISFFISLLGLITAMELTYYIANIIHTERYECTGLIKKDEKLFLDSLNRSGKRINANSYPMASLIYALSSDNQFVDIHANQDLYYLAHYSKERRRMIFDDKSGVVWNEIVLNGLKNVVEAINAIAEYVDANLDDPSWSFYVKNQITKPNARYYYALFYSISKKSRHQKRLFLIENLRSISFSSGALSQLIKYSVDEDRFNVITSDSVQNILGIYLDLLRLLDIYISQNTYKLVKSKFLIFNRKLYGNMLAHSWAYPLTNILKTAIYQIIIAYFEDMPKLEFSQENATLLQGFVDFSK